MNFNFFENLPILVLALAFFIVFLSFLSGGFILLSARDDIQKIEKGRKILLNSLYGFFIVLLVTLVFFLVTNLLQKGEALQPPEVPGEFPSSPAINFPPSPQFVKIGEYYFMGRLLLKENNIIKEAGIYVILCKKNGEYDIMYIGETGGEQLLKHKQYSCWMEKCSQESQDIYLTIFGAQSKKYGSVEREKIKKELESQINPPCNL